jgi:hypothetical protein
MGVELFHVLISVHGQYISNPIELFVLNLGLQESVKAKDSQVKECYGYLHVNIKLEIVIAFENAKNTAMYGNMLYKIV